MVNNNLYFISQKSFSNCLSIKGRKLKFDFYLPDYNLCIEYDGPQHYNKKNFLYSDLLYENDKIKNKFCENNNIKLIRIKYKKDFNNNHIDSIIKNIINEKLEKDKIIFYC